jgi:ABC-type lipoprotein release transport system permease subunit
MVVVVMTVMTGLLRDFKVKNHNWVGDCVVSTDSLVGFPGYGQFAKILEQQDFVKSVSTAIRSYGILTEQSGWNTGVEIMGIDPVKHSRATGFAETLHYHKAKPAGAFEPDYDANLPGCVLGIDKVSVRDQYGRYSHRSNIPAYSFTVSCFPLTAGGALAKAGLGLVNTKRFYYSDDSHSGLAKVDGAFIYLPFADAQALCGMHGQTPRASVIHIKFKVGVNLQTGRNKVAKLWKDFLENSDNGKQANLLSKVRVETWKTYRRQVIAAVEKEQIMMMVVFGMIGIITVFIVFVVFYMLVSHKSKDIGILKSIGIASRDVIELFLGFAFLVAVCGSAIGTAGGVLFLTKINHIERWLCEHYGFQLWNRAIYAIDEIPNKVEFDTITVIIISAILASLVGALIPSWQAARLKPVETLQVNQL